MIDGKLRLSLYPSIQNIQAKTGRYNYKVNNQPPCAKCTMDGNPFEHGVHYAQSMICTEVKTKWNSTGFRTRNTFILIMPLQLPLSYPTRMLKFSSRMMKSQERHCSTSHHRNSKQRPSPYRKGKGYPLVHCGKFQHAKPELREDKQTPQPSASPRWPLEKCGKVNSGRVCMKIVNVKGFILT